MPENNALTSDNIQVTSTDPSGATFATGFYNGAHYQYVKLVYGSEGSAYPVSNSTPLPIVYTSAENNTYVPVSGSTSGLSPVMVQITGGASFDAANVTISSGTLDTIANGVSSDIRTIASGITVGVETIGSVKLGITGEVTVGTGSNNIGDVDILSVTIPSAITCGAKEATDTGATFTNKTDFASGIRVTNAGASVTAYVGPSGITAGSGYPLSPFDTVFLELSDGSSLRILTASGTTDIRFIGS